MHDENVTIEDVARLAGLSMATVSRVMHENPRVSPEARARVLAAVDSLGYTPNALARGLVMSKTRTLGVLVSSISDPFWGEVVQAIQRLARQEQYGVLIAASDENSDSEQEALELFRHKRVDGIIVGASSSGTSILRDQRFTRVPLVFVNNEHFVSERQDGTQDLSASAHLVATDDVRGGQLAVEHLLQLGHRGIGYIGPSERASSINRLEGYRAALAQAGVAPDSSWVRLVGEGPTAGELATFRAIAGNPELTALFCYDDMTAVGALRALRALRLRVPADISLVGFDDIPLAAYLDPPLTTVRQPTNQLGMQAVRGLLTILRTGQHASTITVQGELIVRDSTGAAPKDPRIFPES